MTVFDIVSQWLFLVAFLVCICKFKAQVHQTNQNYKQITMSTTFIFRSPSWIISHFLHFLKSLKIETQFLPYATVSQQCTLGHQISAKLHMFLTSVLKVKCLKFCCFVVTTKQSDLSFCIHMHADKGAYAVKVQTNNKYS